MSWNTGKIVARFREAARSAKQKKTGAFSRENRTTSVGREAGLRELLK